MKKNIDYWTELLTNIPDSFKKWFKEESKYLQKIITPNSKILDVGCGDGRSIFDIISITKNVIGIDHDEKAIFISKTNFSKQSSVKFIKEDATNLSFHNDTFDFIICMGTFANFAKDKFTVLSELKRVLKKSGKIIISVYSENAFDERMKIYKASGVKIKEIKDGTVIFDESLGDNISEQFSEEQLKDIFSQAHLHIEDITRVNIAYLCTLTK